MNGEYTPFCYGWIKISASIEVSVARKFNVQPFLWDRPPGTEHERVRGILFEYIEGNTLANIQITPQIVNDIRSGLKGLHNASIAHGDVRASNILVQGNRVKWIDLSASLTMPHIRISKQKLREIQAFERQDLEIGFALLSSVRFFVYALFIEYMRLTEPASHESRNVCCWLVAYRHVFSQRSSYIIWLNKAHLVFPSALRLSISSESFFTTTTATATATANVAAN